jgi:Flp pilus assembly protein TadG
MCPMKTLQQLVSKIRDQRGASAIIVALVMVVLIGITALAVDIGYIMVRGNELQNIADASSLAATRQLAWMYKDLKTAEEQQTYVCNPSDIKPVAQEVAAKNDAGGYVSLEVTIGDWDTTTKTFAETLNQPDAVKVRAAREGARAGIVSQNPR